MPLVETFNLSRCRQKNITKAQNLDNYLKINISRNASRLVKHANNRHKDSALILCMRKNKAGAAGCLFQISVFQLWVLMAPKIQPPLSSGH